MSTFHGIELKSQAVHEVRCTTSSYPPDFTTAAHAHPQAYFCLVIEGASEQRSGNRERVRDCGRAYFYPPNEVQSERFGRGGGRLFSVQIGPGTFGEIEADARLPRASCELAGRAALILRRLQLASARDEALDVEDEAMRLLAALAQERSSAARWAPLAREYVHAHFREKPTLAAIARAAGVHPVHLSRAFPQRFGITLGEYVRSLRVDWAARELVASDRPIADVALAAGFASQSHLTRELKRLLGITPGAYRLC